MFLLKSLTKALSTKGQAIGLLAISALFLPSALLGQFTTSSSGSEITITGYTGSNSSVVIPATINGLPVVTIGPEAFRETTITSVTIPDSVTSIGIQAFLFCSDLNSVTMGNSVEVIDFAAFLGCSSLTAISLPDSLLRIAENAFRQCSNLEGIIIPDSVTTMEDLVFSECSSLKTVTIGNSVQSIGEFSFHSCVNLETVSFGSSLTEIGLLAFFDCDSLTTITLPKNLTTLGQSAFQDCNNLQSVSLGDELTEIGNAAFSDCVSLSVVAMPDTVSEIGISAFAGCLSLRDITLSSGLERIGNNAFSLCINLETIIAKGSILAPQNIGEDIFEGSEAATFYYLSPSAGWSTVFAGLSTSLLPQLITTDGQFGVTNNQFGFTVVGSADSEAIVQVSTDFVSTSWVEAGRVTLDSSGNGYFVDSNWSAQSKRYYRMEWP